MFNFIKNYAARPEDSEDLRFSKQLIFIVAGSCCLCGFIWSGLCQYVYGGGLPMQLPLWFVLIVGSALVIGGVTKSYHIPVYAQLSCITFITALIQWSIGTLADSGIVMTWAFLGPVGALLFLSRKSALQWLIIFIILIIITIYFEPKIGDLVTEVNDYKRQLLYTMNLVFPLCLMFAASLYFFVKLKNQKEENLILLEITNEKNQEILDSINYAKRIQDAIMPNMEAMHKALGNGFVLYLPKDVVAGDFFWMEQDGDSVYYAAADCTGHGVPGAMVSVVCSNALTKAFLEEGIRDTGKLLNRTRELVINQLAKSGEEVKDGMDISLCAWNKKTNQLQWSGANNPLWILRKNAQEIEETKADKQPIGMSTDTKPFTTHKFQLNEGDAVYVFTDGYQDQFGGPKGKKFKAAQLKQLLIDNQNNTMLQQNELLKTSIKNWKGDLEQVDDVCVIGVKI